MKMRFARHLSSAPPTSFSFPENAVLSAGNRAMTPERNANGDTQPLGAEKTTSFEQLGPYQVTSQIGAGGMGLVFRGVDTRLGRAVAIKTSQEKFSDRFQREARAISSINHP